MKKLAGVSALALVIMAVSAVCRADGFEPFSNKSLHGTYVVKFQGTNSGGDGALEGASLAPVNGVALLNADGDGDFTGTQTANILFNTNGTPTSASPAPVQVPLASAPPSAPPPSKGLTRLIPTGPVQLMPPRLPLEPIHAVVRRAALPRPVTSSCSHPSIWSLSAPTLTRPSAARQPCNRAGDGSTTTTRAISAHTPDPNNRYASELSSPFSGLGSHFSNPLRSALCAVKE
jgi:hypothetical protein